MSAAANQEPSEREQRPDELIRKAGAVVQRFEELRAEIARAQDAIQRGQAREALMRSQLTEALLATLAERAASQGRLRSLTAQLYFCSPRAGSGLLRRAAWSVRAALARLGSPGQALLIAASGLWRPSGRPLNDLRHVAAYARRRADPSVAPASLFDQAAYLRLYPDVAERRASPLLHYLLAGQAEGRSPHPLFDADFYARRNGEDMAARRLWPLAHFVSVGARAGRDPHPVFDLAYYAGHAPVLAPDEDLVSHYLREGWRLGLSPHPLFDPAWYGAQMPAGAAGAAGEPPLVHFLSEGAAAGLSPHPLFDPDWYLAQAPEAASAGPNPLSHFLTVGAGQGLSPGPWFDLPHYVARRGAALPAGRNPLIDYLLGGAWAVGEPAPGFATAGYLAAHPDCVEQGLTPLEHWARAHATDRPAAIDRLRSA